MNIGTSIIVLAGWLPVVAAALSPSITSKGFNNMKIHAWILTLLAMGWEALIHFG